MRFDRHDLIFHLSHTLFFSFFVHALESGLGKVRVGVVLGLRWGWGRPRIVRGSSEGLCVDLAQGPCADHAVNL